MSDSQLSIKVERIHRLNTGGTMKAFVDMNVNDALLIKGLRILESPKGLFVSMPQEQGKDKKWYDTIRCITPEVRRLVTEKVLEAYQEA